MEKNFAKDIQCEAVTARKEILQTYPWLSRARARQLIVPTDPISVLTKGKCALSDADTKDILLYHARSLPEAQAFEKFALSLRLTCRLEEAKFGSCLRIQPPPVAGTKRSLASKAATKKKNKTKPGPGLAKTD